MKGLGKTGTIRLGAVIGAAILLAACSRPSDNKTSNLEIIAPSKMNVARAGVGTMSSASLQHLVINVSASDMSPVVFSWDSGGSNSKSSTSPSSFNVTVPSGSSRLVQVLAVYASSDGSGGANLYYGDVTQDITQSSASVAVSVSAIGGGEIISGNVSGRYFTSAGHGPSGPVSVQLAPPGGKPALIIETDAIYDGWFNVLLLDGASLNYVLPDGSLMWGQAVNAATFSPATTIVKAAVPVNFRSQNENGTNTWQANSPSEYVYGWFATNASFLGGKNVCVSSTLSSLSQVVPYAGSGYSGGTAPTGSPTGFTGTTSTTTYPSLANLLNTTAPLTSYWVVGGNSSCGTGTEYVDQITLSALPTMLNGNGNDGASYIFPPLVAQTSSNNRQALSMTQISTPVTGYKFSGQFLSGLQPGLIDGISVYKRVLNDGWQWNEDGAPCGAISTGAYNFVPVFGSPLSSNIVPITADAFSINVPLSSSEVSTGTNLAFCYTKGAAIVGSGVMIRSDNFNNGGNSSPPTQIKMTLQDAGTLTQLNQTACMPALLELLDSSNNVAYPSSPVSINLSSTVAGSGAGSTFYMDPSCLQTVSNPYSTQQGYQMLYYKVPATQGSLTIVAHDTASVLSDSSVSGLTIGSGGGTPNKLAFVTVGNSTNLMTPTLPVTMSSLPSNICAQALLQVQDANGAPVGTMEVPNTVQSSTTLLSGVINLYTDTNCLTSGSSFTWNGNGSVSYTNTPVNVKAGSAGGTNTVSSFLGTYNLTGSTSLALGTLPTDATKLNLNVMGSVYNGTTMTIPRGICLPIMVGEFDSAGQPSVQTAATSFTVSVTTTGTAPTVVLGANPTCGSGMAPPYSSTLSTSNPTNMVYLKITGGDATTTLSMTASTTSSPSLTSYSWPLGTSNIATASLFAPKFMLSYSNVSDPNTMWVPLTEAGGGSNWESNNTPPANIQTQCRSMYATLLDGSGSLYSPPTAVTFTAFRNSNATDGFYSTCTGGGFSTNSFTFGAYQNQAEVGFYPANASIALGNQSIYVSGTTTDFLSSSPIDMSVGLRLDTGLTSPNPVPTYGTCNSHMMQLTLNNTAHTPITLAILGNPDLRYDLSVSASPSFSPTNAIITTSSACSGSEGMSPIPPGLLYYVDLMGASSGSWIGIGGSWDVTGLDYTWGGANIQLQQ